MKRESVKNKCPYIYHHKTLLFWHKCRFCGKEFRRENGWRILDYPIINGIYSQSYCCESCGGNKKEVLNKIINVY